ncbi:MAG: type II toxin-antitoxin system RelE/ParE family toxin [Bacilli bacterium]|nr:type II toxin-antitoxin system RelE/ParE family toxin [Bacilli bacterium]
MGEKYIEKYFKEFDIVWEPDQIDEIFFGYTNLKKDFKKIGLKNCISKQHKVINSIVYEISNGPRANINIVLYEVKIKNTINKIRVKNENDNRGKSGGYRAICLVDMNNRISFLLHIYSKSEKENINQNEYSNFKICLEEYVK